jgi:hypothetical protein
LFIERAGQADIDPVEIGDEVAQHQEGDDPPRNLRDRALFYRVNSCFPPWDTDSRPH